MKLELICKCLLVGLLFNGCVDSDSDFISNSYSEKIVIPKLKEESIFLYSQFCDTVTHVFLETNSNCLIGDISKIQIKDSLLYIGDFSITQSIFVFNLKGKFIKKLFKQGHGPGEYAAINNFNVDEQNNIYILDNRLGKEFIYDSNFKPIFERKIESFFITAATGDTDKSVYYCGNEPNQEKFRYQILIRDNKKNKIERKFFKYPSGNEKLIFVNENHFRYSDGFIFLKPSYSQYIYSIGDSLKHSYTVQFDNVDNFVDLEKMLEMKNSNEVRKYVYQNNIVDIYDFDISKSWIYLKIQKGNANYFAFYDRDSKKCQVARKLGNDLSYSLLLGRVIGLYEDCIVSYTNTDFIKRNFKQDEIEKKFGNIDEMSNPVLILAKLKRHEN